MANTVHCPHCGRDIPRPYGPNARCPACQKPIAGAQVEAAHASTTAAPTGSTRWAQSEIAASEFPVPADGYEDLGLALDPEAAAQPRPPSRPAVAAAQAPAPIRHPSESSLAAARMANAPTFKVANARGGLPVVPISVGVVLILAITAFALTRGKSASRPVPAPSAGDPQVTTIGRPPESASPAYAEPEPPQPVVTIEPSDDGIVTVRERRKPPEREATARPARPAPAAREVARNDKAPAATPVPAPKAEPELPLPLPPPPPPPVAAPAREAPIAAAPLAIGPTYAREGYQKARQASPGCVARSLALSRDIVDVEGESSTVKFAVDEAGKVSEFTYLSGPTDQRIRNAIQTAVRSCEWIPGATAQGQAIKLWVTMPIKFGK